MEQFHLSWSRDIFLKFFLTQLHKQFSIWHFPDSACNDCSPIKYIKISSILIKFWTYVDPESVGYFVEATNVSFFIFEFETSTTAHWTDAAINNNISRKRFLIINWLSSFKKREKFIEIHDFPPEYQIQIDGLIHIILSLCLSLSLFLSLPSHSLSLSLSF